MTSTAHRDDLITKAGLVLLALQIALFANFWLETGFDQASNGFPVFVMSTALFVAGQRKLAAKPPNPGAARWIGASRGAVLAMLTLGTLAVGFYRLMPDRGPAPSIVPQSLFALMWVVIALKGAAMGKLKPGSAMGLCVSWTRESRLAWDRGHRTLGRILFWGGLVGFASSFIVEAPASIGLWFATVATAVTAALVESWRSWRVDPDRLAGRPA